MLSEVVCDSAFTRCRVFGLIEARTNFQRVQLGCRYFLLRFMDCIRILQAEEASGKASCKKSCGNH